nr:enoyl-CoA hydratase-related protein [Nocardioides alcanivorans]
MSNEAPHALVELVDHKLVVTLNRPEARNALSGEMLQLMEQAWERANTDPEVRVVILTGAGGAFCAGADLKAMSKDSPGDKFESGTFDPSIIKALLKGYRLNKPLIAAVEGAAIAGGTEILTATDIRIAGESARFGVSEAKWSLYPLGGSVVRLPARCPTPSPWTCCSPDATSRRTRRRRSVSSVTSFPTARRWPRHTRSPT